MSFIEKIKKVTFPSRMWFRRFIKMHVFVDEFFVVRYQFKLDDIKHDLRCGYPLNADSVVVDFGGYKGEWAKRIWDKYQCNIYMFEPVKAFYEHAKGVFEGNPKVHACNFGVSDQDAEEKISIDGVASSIYAGEKKELIQLRDVNEVIRELDLTSIDLLKINIEGGEFKVLPRMIGGGLISRCKNIQIEFHLFYPHAESLRAEIQKELAKTHHLTYDYPFFFENWALNS